MRFLIKSTFKAPPTDEAMALIPAEKARSQELADQGVREALYTAADRSAVWFVWNCDSHEAVEETLQSLPMYDFLDFEVTLLA